MGRVGLPRYGRCVSALDLPDVSLSPAAWRRIDGVVAVALLVGLTSPALLTHDDPPLAVLALGAGATLPIAVRRRWPVAVLVVVVACTVAADLLGIRFSPFGSNAGPSVGLAIYTVAERLDRRFSVAALAGVVTATFASTWIATYTYTEDQNAVHVVAAVVGWLVGDAVRARRTYRADLAARQRLSADERTHRAIAEERLRISREVHDVISHNLSVIAVRSGIGRMLFETQPEEARAALAEVETVSRNALTELRRLLGAVRDQDPRSPAPCLDDLPRLVEQLTADVTLEQRGLPTALPRTLELSAYRIVQEALTNVVKHAGGAGAQVVVEYGDEELIIEVTDEGHNPEPAASGGWGIVGMRERAAIFGGTVEAGPRPEGGFRVYARFPIGADR